MPTADRIQVLCHPATRQWSVHIDGSRLRDSYGRERTFQSAYAAFMAGWEALRRRGCAFDRSMEEALAKYR
jgi:hypothetical protein